MSSQQPAFHTLLQGAAMAEEGLVRCRVAAREESVALCEMFSRGDPGLSSSTEDELGPRGSTRLTATDCAGNTHALSISIGRLGKSNPSSLKKLSKHASSQPGVRWEGGEPEDPKLKAALGRYLSIRSAVASGLPIGGWVQTQCRGDVRTLEADLDWCSCRMVMVGGSLVYERCDTAGGVCIVSGAVGEYGWSSGGGGSLLLRGVAPGGSGWTARAAEGNVIRSVLETARGKHTCFETMHLSKELVVCLEGPDGRTGEVVVATVLGPEGGGGNKA